MKKQSFLKGATIMMCSAVLVKIVGALYKIPLSAILGGRGMGYFMCAYGIFNPIYALVAGGLPPAVASYVSRQITKKGEKKGEEIFYCCLVLFSVLGIIITALCYGFSNSICKIMGNENALMSVRAILPCIFLCCFNAAFKGYFEGNRQMTPTAMSQVTEVFIKLFFGIFLAKLAIERGLREFFSFSTVLGEKTTNIADAMEKIMPYAAAQSIWGVTVSTLFGSLVMIIYFFVLKKQNTVTVKKEYLKHVIPILKIAIPISLLAFIINLYPLIDLVTVMRGLQITFKNMGEATEFFPLLAKEFDTSAEFANFLYGCYSGIAMTFFHIIPAITASLSAVALPLISSLSARGELMRTHDTAEAILRFSALFCFPAGIGLCIMAEPILNFLFWSSPMEVMASVPLLQVLGIAAVFVGMSAPAFSILQGMGKPYIPTGLLAIFTVLKLLLNLLLVINKSINVMAAPISTLLCYFFISKIAIKNVSLASYEKISFLKISIKPFLLSILCCPIAKVLYIICFKGYNNGLRLIFSIFMSGILYILLLWISGEFKQHYIKMLCINKKV